MSAEMGKRDNQTGVEMAWHGLTNVVPVVTRENSGIVYPMAKRALINPYTGEETPHFGIFSLDDNRPIGGTVSDNYQLFSNEQMFDMVESALGGTSHKINSVGTVADRSKVYVSVKLDANFVAGGRETEGVLNVIWGHGGKLSIISRSGFTVVVCSNTLAMALGQGREILRMKHTGNASVKLENMEKAIDSHCGVAAEFKAAMDSLDRQTCSPNEAKEVFAGFLVRDADIEKVPSRTVNTIGRLSTLFATGKGNNGRTMADTLNAFTDYYTHESSGGEGKDKNMQKQLESSEFGSGATRKSEAFELLTGNRVDRLGDLDTVMRRGNQVLQMV